MLKVLLNLSWLYFHPQAPWKEVRACVRGSHCPSCGAFYQEEDGAESKLQGGTAIFFSFIFNLTHRFWTQCIFLIINHTLYQGKVLVLNSFHKSCLRQSAMSEVWKICGVNIPLSCASRSVIHTDWTGTTLHSKQRCAESFNAKMFFFVSLSN